MKRSLLAIFTALIFLFIFGFLVNDNLFSWLKVEMVRTISLFLSLLIAGFIAGYIARSRGLIHGFISGTLIYIVPLFVFSIIAFYGVYFEKANFAGNTKDLVNWLKPYISASGLWRVYWIHWGTCWSKSK